MNLSISRKTVSGIVVAFLIAAFLMVVGSAPKAEAHTTVQSVTANSKLLRITFSGPIRRGSIKATNSRGKVVSKGRGGRDPKNNTRLRVGLKNLRPGTYKATWRMVAIDGHSQSGVVSFRVR